jgi:hypothetical protein
MEAVDMNAVIGTQDLVGRYCEAVLRNDPAIFASAWTEDATWSIPGRGTITGRAAILKTFSFLRGGYPLCVQEVLNGRVVSTSERRATASWQVRELRWHPDGTGSELIGVYHDAVEVSPAGPWQFAKRDFELLYDGPVDLSGRLRLAR